jgi:hypothetical protein
MKKQIIFLLTLGVLLTGCNANEAPNPKKDPEVETYPYATKTDLHTGIINQNITDTIGDVHPYYDETSKKWYLFYLDTSGNYQTRLRTSSDGVVFTENNDFTVKYSIAPYSVLNVCKKGTTYYSYFGEFQCTTSTDLVHWEYSGKKNQIAVSTSIYNGGFRDPSVCYDETTKKSYAVGIAYKKSGTTTKANLIVMRSKNDSQTSYETPHEVFLEDTINHDAECPMLLKIKNRYYLFYSVYGNSVHGVGKLTYRIGDEGVDPYDVDWTTKEEHFLTGEDLCAAQVAKKGNDVYLFGWIPQQSNGGTWGGSLNLLTKVTSSDTGILNLSFDDTMESKLIKKSLGIKTNITQNEAGSMNVSSNRYYCHINFKLSQNMFEIKAQKQLYRIVVDKDQSLLLIYSKSHLCSSIAIDREDFFTTNDLIFVVENNVLEVELNHRYVLTARVDEVAQELDAIEWKSDSCYVNLIEVNRLAYLEEM